MRILCVLDLNLLLEEFGKFQQQVAEAGIDEELMKESLNIAKKKKEY